jgi:trehalose-phosphatase
LGNNDGLIVVSYFLPVIVTRVATAIALGSSFGTLMGGGRDDLWHVEWDHEALLSLKSQLRVTRVGSVRFRSGEAPTSFEERDALIDALQPFLCVPVFIEQDLATLFYDSFCKKTLWPTFHNLLEIYGPVPTGQALDSQANQAFKEVLRAEDMPNSLKRESALQQHLQGGQQQHQTTSSQQQQRLFASLPSQPPRGGIGGGVGGIGGVSGSIDLSHNEPGSPSAGGDRAGGGPPQRDPWGAYMSVQREFKTKIMEVYHEGDLVWVHGFHLLLVPTLFGKAHAAAKIGLFLHTPFPSSEIFRTLGRREDLLRGMLSADQVGFHLYEYARHFLTCCRRLLGLEWTHEANGINIHYGGRSVLVTCVHAGMDQDVLRSVITKRTVTLEMGNLLKLTQGKTVFAGIDRLERLKGVPLKLLAYERFLATHPEHVGRVVLYQVGLTAGERGGDYEQTCHQVQHLVRRINERFNPSRDPLHDLVLYDEREEVRCQLKHRLALLSVANCFVVTTVRDGLNRWPLEYVSAQAYMRQEAEQAASRAAAASGVAGGAQASGAPLWVPGSMILSEFTSCCRVLNGSLHVNPWKIDEVAGAMQAAMVMDSVERLKRHQMDDGFVKAHTTASWCGRVLQDLKGVKKSADASRYVTLGFGLNRRVTAMKAGFEQLDKGKVVKAYRKAANRLILLDYGGTIVDESGLSLEHLGVGGLGGGLSGSGSGGSIGGGSSGGGNAGSGQKRARPEPRLIATLKELCKDKRNRVYVLSGKVCPDLEQTLGKVPGLGLVAEAGFFFRRPEAKPLGTSAAAALAVAEKASQAEKAGGVGGTAEDEGGWYYGGGGGGLGGLSSPSGSKKMVEGSSSGEWEKLLSDNDTSWKTIALSVMEVYKERTHGVFIQQHESAVVWQFRDADLEFAMIQSKELEDQLQQLLKALNAVVLRGDDYIEVRPAGISKGDFIQTLLDEQYVEGPPDFVLCIGDDNSDEKSYQVVKRFMRAAAITSSFTGSSGLTVPPRVPGHATVGPGFLGATGQPGGGGPVLPGVHFTATVGKKPTLADAYLHQVDDVIEMLESMSKTAGLEHSMSMGNFASPTGFGSGSTASPYVPTPQHPPALGVLNTIDEQPKAQALSGGSGRGMARSMSTPAMPSLRRPSSMMLTEYFTSISEDKGAGPAVGEESEDPEGVWF